MDSGKDFGILEKLKGVSASATTPPPRPRAGQVEGEGRRRSCLDARRRPPGFGLRQSGGHFVEFL